MKTRNFDKEVGLVDNFIEFLETEQFKGKKAKNLVIFEKNLKSWLNIDSAIKNIL